MSRRPAKAVIDEAACLPDWFAPDLHVASDCGIMERATGHFLDADGQPASPAVRAQTAMPAAELTADVTAPAEQEA